MSTFSGQLQIHAATRADGRTVLATQSFRAPFHLSKPYWNPDVRALLVQVVNPTAGILSGDQLESRIVVDRAAALVVTTPSASRVFQMRTGEAVSRQDFTVAAGAWLEVMPEPLVPHRGSRFRQVTSIEVETGGALFYVDQLMPGRVGHGEAWQWDRLQIDLTVRVGGQLALRERFDQTGPELKALAAQFGSGAETCFANAVLIAPVGGLSRPPWCAALDALHGKHLWVGRSELRRGGWYLRLVAANSLTLRAGLRDVRAILAGHFPYLSFDLRKL